MKDVCSDPIRQAFRELCKAIEFANAQREMIEVVSRMTMRCMLIDMVASGPFAALLSGWGDNPQGFATGGGFTPQAQPGFIGESSCEVVLPFRRPRPSR